MSENGSVNLSPRQHKALRALLTETTVAGAAIASGVGQSTLYKWLSDQTFRQALAQAEGEAVAAAGRKLVALAQTALDELDRAMTDPQTPAPVKVRACEVVLTNLIRYREVAQFETRLAALEQEMRGG